MISIKKFSFSSRLLLMSFLIFSVLFSLFFAATNYFLYYDTKDFIHQETIIIGKSFLSNHGQEFLLSPNKKIYSVLKSYCSSNDLILGLAVSINRRNTITYPENTSSLNNPVSLPIFIHDPRIEPSTYLNISNDIKNTKKGGTLVLYPDYSAFNNKFISLLKLTGSLFMIFLLLGGLAIHRAIRLSMNDYLNRFTSILKSPSENANIKNNDEFDSILLNFERTAKELDITRKKLLRQEKISSLVTLASGIAHEINNCLTPAIGYSSLLDIDDSFSKEQKEYIEIIQSSLDSAKRIVKNMLTLCGNSINEKIEKCSLEFLIKRFIKTYCYSYKKNNMECPVVFTPSNKPIECEINPGQFNQILFNIVKNSIQAYPETSSNKNVEIELEEDESNCYIIISDKASGMTEETKTHIFDPFYTTKPVGSGTGLGMAIVYSIVKSYNGEINIDSSLGVGTTFTISIPKKEEIKVLKSDEISDDDFLSKQEGDILVIEDSEEIRNMIKDFLSDTKLKIHTFVDFKAAKKSLLSIEPRLIISDLKIPYMPGIKIYYALRKEDPELVQNFAIISATVSDKEKSVIDNENIPFLQKPFDYSEFRSFIASVLKRSKQQK